MRGSGTLALTVLVAFPLLAQGTRDTTGIRGEKPRARIARADSGAHADTLAAADTLGRMSTPSLVGTLDRAMDTLDVRTTGDIHWIDYRYLGGILETFPGISLRDQVSEGQYTQIALEGVDWRGIAFSANGRPLADPASGIFNMYNFTPEYADRIEVVSGPRAFLYGLNSTGGAVNLVTKNYNSNKPFTKFNYAEGAYGYSLVDGTFSQNISRRTNITVGFQHQVTDGRFAGEAHDAWNSREKVRFNISRDLNVIFSHYLTSGETGLNGGVKPSGATSFDVVQAVPMDTAYQKYISHDVDISLVGTLLGDTADVSNLTFYYSHAKREFRENEDPYFILPARVSSDHLSSWAGVRLAQNIVRGAERFDGGASVEARRIEGSPNLGTRRDVVAALWAKEEVDLSTPGAGAAVYGRLDRYLGRTYGALGADLRLDVGGGLSVRGGGSASYRLPTYEELFWTDSTVVRSGPVVAEHHTLLEAGAAWESAEHGSLRATLFHRTVTDPILLTPYRTVAETEVPGVAIANGPPLMSTGLSLGFNLRFAWLLLEGTAEYLIQRSGGNTLSAYPKISGEGGVFFRRRVIGGRLDLKAGFQGRFTGPYAGVRFNPELLAAVANTGAPLGTSASGGFLLIAHIGDAYIQFAWENIAAIRYYGTPWYPGTDRGIRFGISWEFLN
ncbi:MAG TPA: TonB-dependent receptor plug domain-containing protein [Bacteroidota bacterium]|nr:TonB-dependent receptor plug domain-containing protein [Bacteroidota bacterium]